MAYKEPLTEITQLLNNTKITINSVVSAGKELATIPKYLQKFEMLGINKIDLSSVADFDINNFIAELSRLNDSQRQASFSLLNLNDSQRENIVTMLELIKPSEILNPKIHQEQLSCTNLNNATQKMLPTQSGLIDSTGKYVFLTADQAKTNIEAAANTLKLSSAQKDLAVNTMGQTVAVQTQTTATVGATAAQIAWNAVLNIGKQLLMGLVASAIVWDIQKLVNVASDLIITYDELKENAQNAKNCLG